MTLSDLSDLSGIGGFLLALLVALCGLGWWLYQRRKPVPSASNDTTFMKAGKNVKVRMTDSTVAKKDTVFNVGHGADIETERTTFK